METSIFDSYFNSYDEQTQSLLRAVDKHISDRYPQLQRKLSYGMPTFALKKNIIHFAAMKHHFGIYPGPQAIEFFENELKSYKTSKGAIQIPYDHDIPYQLIDAMIDYNIELLNKEPL